MKNLIINHVLKRQYKKILRDQAHPRAAQERAFRRLKKSLGQTPNAKRLGLDQAADLDGYLKKGKATSYSDYAELIDQVLKEPTSGLLFKDSLEFVGLSSGTTLNNSKRLPVNTAARKNFEDFQKSLASILSQEHGVNLFKHGRVSWGSGSLTEYTPSGIPCGYVSGYLSARMPRLFRSKSFPQQKNVLLEKDMQAKARLLADELGPQNVALLIGVPSYLLQLLESLKMKWQIDDFKAQWSELKTLVYSATAIEPYKEQIEKILGFRPNYLGCYASTEAPIGIEIPSLSGGKSGCYCFHLGDVVYSFRRLNDPTKSFIRIDELRVGDEVEVFVSTPSGLLNYSMGDTLRIVSVKPYVSFEIMGRIGEGINIATEKVTARELQSCIAKLQEESGLAIRHYFVSPGLSKTGKPRYEWTLFLDEGNTVSIEKLRTQLDQLLIKMNPDYDENRCLHHFLDEPAVFVASSRVVDLHFAELSHRGQLKIKTSFATREQFENYARPLFERANIDFSTRQVL